MTHLSAKFVGVRDRILRGESLLETSLILITVIIARAQAIVNPLYAIDTYSFTDTANDSSWYSQMFEQGRYGLALLWWTGKAFDVGHFDEAVFGYSMSVVLMAITGILLSKIITNHASSAHSSLFALIFCLHPFMNELFHFADGTLMFSLAMVLSSVGLFVSLSFDDRNVGYCAGSFCIALSLSIYQTALGYIIIAASMSIVNSMCQTDEMSRDELIKLFVRRMAAIVSGLTLYFIFVLIANKILSVHMTSRFDPESFLNFKSKLGSVLEAIELCMWPRIGYVTQAENIDLLICMALSFLIVVRRSYRKAGTFGLLSIIFITAMSLIISASLTVVSREVWLVPRTLSGFAVFSGAVIASGWIYAVKRERLVLGAGVIVLIASYVGVANRTIRDQTLVNRWDLAQANRIVERLEENDRFNEVRSLALVGGSWARTVPVSSVWGDMNISAFGASWAKIGLIEQATGLRFESPSASESQNAVGYCKSNGAWPARTSVVVLDGLAVVCLTKPL